MEGEVNNLIMVWITILASLLYCHTVSNFILKGTTRLAAFLPVIFLYLFLPLNLTSIYLTGLTSFFISWLANFKLLLFAFGEGPLSSTPALSHFIPTASFPIKILPEKPSKLEILQTHQEKKSKFEFKESPSHFFGKNEDPSHPITKRPQKSPLDYATKIMVFGLLLKVNDYYKENMHPNLRMALYCVHIYVFLEIFLAMLASLAGAVVRVELEPQFDAPHYATSVQNFWGKRWNLMASSILRPTVYQPVRSISSRLIPKEWVSLPAVFATFLVSGIVHELIYYYIGRQKPTGEVTCYFLIQGVWVCIEIVIKKVTKGKFQLPAMVSGPMALGFVMATSFWLFFPPLLRFNPAIRACKETLAFIQFFTQGRYVSPYEVSCPYFV